MVTYIGALVATATGLLAKHVQADCLADTTLNTIFAEEVNGVSSIPIEGSCCQFDVCAIPCPLPVEKPGVGTFVFLLFCFTACL